MRILMIGLLLALAVDESIAQKAPLKFGDIPLEDLKMTLYAGDTSATAVVLADFGESSLAYSQTDGFSVNFERTTRIKILTTDGLDWATFSIPLYHDGGNSEKLSGLKAATYNLEQEKMVSTKLKNESVFKEKVTTNWDMMKITLPAVRAGSIIEITYKVNSDFLFNFQDWQFQYSIPVRWSEYRANIPEFYGYDKYMQGYVSLSVNETKDVPSFLMLSSKERSGSKVTQTDFNTERIEFMEKRSRWVAQDVPAFKPEPFITTPKDYISKLNFELSYKKFPDQPIKSFMGSWAEINTLFSEHANFGGEISGNNFLRKIVEEITVGLTTPEQKIKAITAYVQNHVEWNGSSEKFTDTPLKKVLEDKRGSSSEINLLLASMLEKAGVDAYGVLVSTRDHGFVREQMPISSQFNYVICLATVDQHVMLLDATDKLLPAGVLPERCLNGRGFMISKKGSGWIDLKTPQKSRALYQTELTLGEDGLITGKVSADRSGYYGYSERKNFLTKGEPDYVKELASGSLWKVENSAFTNTHDIGEPFKEVHEVVIEDHVTRAGDMMYINPFIVLQLRENPFKLEHREYPVDFGSPMEQLLIAKIAIPEGYVVDEVPKNCYLRLPENGGKYIYSISLSGNMIMFSSNLQVNNSLYSQTEYPNLREFYSMIVAKQAEQIVLKKK